MQLWLTLLFAVSWLWGAVAPDIVDTYRTKGIEPIEELLDRQLAEPAFWRKTLKRHDLAYGYFDKESDLLLCSKQDKELQLYRVNGHFRLKHKSRIILGRMPGDKQSEGDLRTPIGVYRIVARKTDPGDEYGPLAFVTDYPNRFDRILGKNGHGIWLHGFPLDCDDKEATKGCIAVDNDNLLQLDSKLDYKKTLLLISEKPLKKVDTETMANLLAFIYRWRHDWKYNRYDQYLSHYSPDLVYKSKMDFNTFKQYKKRVFDRYEGRKKTLRFYNLRIVPYPNSLGKTLWFVLFDEYYHADGYTFEGEKEILVEETAPGQFKIVVE